MIRAGRRVSAGMPAWAFMAFAILLVIVGLLAMHTLSATHDMPAPGVGMTVSVSGTGAAVDGPMALMGDGVAAGDAAPGAAHCADGGCDPPMPDHSMLMMVCVLAVFAVAIVLLASRVLGWVGAAFPPRLIRTLARTSSAPSRPPSLLVLSISRT